MSKIGQNIIVILGIILVVFTAYYFFTQESALGLNTGGSEQELQQLLQSAQLFSERQASLNAIELNTEILESEAFNSLVDFSEEPKEFQVGRSDPFLPPES